MSVDLIYRRLIMLTRLKNYIVSILDRQIQRAAEKQIDEMRQIIPQFIEYQNSAPEDRQSYYDHIKIPKSSRGYYETLKSSFLKLGLPVEEKTINLEDFIQWKNKKQKFTLFYESLGDVYIEKCLEHYVSYKYLSISENNVYIYIAASSSPWAGYLRSHYNIDAYRLDLSYPEGIHKYDIGADAGKTGLSDHFADVLSAQCAFECFMGDADIRFVQESGRILKGGNLGWCRCILMIRSLLHHLLFVIRIILLSTRVQRKCGMMINGKFLFHGIIPQTLLKTEFGRAYQWI